MPGSVDLHHSESEALNSVDGSSPAFVTNVEGVNATAADVLHFYEQKLAGSGWSTDTVDSVGIPTTAESTVEVWRKGDVVVRLSILLKSDPRVPGSDRADEFQTLYQVTLVAKAPEKAPSEGYAR